VGHGASVDDVNARGESALTAAMRCGNQAGARALVLQGACLDESALGGSHAQLVAALQQTADARRHAMATMLADAAAETSADPRVRSAAVAVSVDCCCVVVLLL